MKKTQKSFRKKALLSSLSMLMVATVAVGSATFAWFTSDPTANADGLKVKATAATGLVINAATENKWTHNATLNKNGADYAGAPISIDPTVADGTITAYSTVAKEDGSYVADGTAAVTTSTAYYTEKINAKITGSEATKSNVKITGLNFGDGVWSDAIRIAITYTDVEPGASDSDPNKETTSLVGIFSAKGDQNKYLTGEGTYATKLSDSNATFPSSTTNTVQVDNTGNDYFQIYVYLDGEDDIVFTDNIVTLGNGVGTQGVKVDFAIAE